MFQALKQILEQTISHLAGLAMMHLPRILAGLILLALAVLVATLARRLLRWLVHATALERFLAQSGLGELLSRSGKVHAARLIADVTYLVLVTGGALVALSAIDTRFTSELVKYSLHVLPRIVAAGAILLAGVWLARYFARGVLVWACNEDLPSPRRLAALVRVLVIFAAVVIAADQLEFARTVFVSAFLIVFGGLMLTASIAGGIAARELVKRRLDKTAAEEADREPFWRHI